MKEVWRENTISGANNKFLFLMGDVRPPSVVRELEIFIEGRTGELLMAMAAERDFMASSFYVEFN
jgi:hypothetical protein